MKNTALRRLILIATIGGLAGIFIFPLNPVNSLTTKALFLGSLVGTWVGLLILMWGKTYLRFAIAGIPFLVAILVLFTGRPVDSVQLESDYVARLRSFEDTPYEWGGESSRGIDCSGLPRRAFRDALLSQGLRGLNGTAIRLFFGQWWFDASAGALGESYRDYTVPLAVKGTILEMDHSPLRRGDLAVSVGGAHILAYVGDGYWIQADPGLGKVSTLHSREDSNFWFEGPVTTHRWRLLNEN